MPEPGAHKQPHRGEAQSPAPQARPSQRPPQARPAAYPPGSWSTCTGLLPSLRAPLRPASSCSAAGKGRAPPRRRGSARLPSPPLLSARRRSRPAHLGSAQPRRGAARGGPGGATRPAGRFPHPMRAPLAAPSRPFHFLGPPTRAGGSAPPAAVAVPRRRSAMGRGLRLLLAALALLAAPARAEGGAAEEEVKIEVLHLPESCSPKSKKGDLLNAHYDGFLASNGSKFYCRWARGCGGGRGAAFPEQRAPERAAVAFVLLSSSFLPLNRVQMVSEGKR